MFYKLILFREMFEMYLFLLHEDLSLFYRKLRWIDSGNEDPLEMKNLVVTQDMIWYEIVMLKRRN